jgi:zinc D-Ala-D-Ala carboxypeptidase
MSHAGIGRALKRPDSTQHGSSPTRRSFVAVALALAIVTLTTADDGLAARSPIAARYFAVMATASSTPTAAPSPTAVPAVEASAEVANVVEAAGEALSDSRYLTTEAAVDRADRDRIMKAASKLRTLVREAVTEPVAPEQTDTAQRAGERSPLPEATSRPEATGRKAAADAPAKVADTAVTSGTGRTSAATREPVDARDPGPVVEPTVPDEPGEAPDQVPATATPTAEEAGRASDSERTTDEAGRASDSEQTTDEAAAAIKEATDVLRTVLDATPAAAVSVKPAPPTPEEIAAQEAAAAAAAAAADAERIAQLVAATAGYGNGLIPLELLCELRFSPGQRLRCDAADRLEHLNTAFAARFGRNLGVSDSYRSYAAQVVTKGLKKDLAAAPGTSQHGWGLAVDLSDGIQSYGTAEYEWMRANAPAFGWDNPDWARQGGTKPEPWHWEYDAPA